jgi:hypothetical protein
MLITLAIGYILLALSEILPKYIKDEDNASTVSFLLALISLIIFAVIMFKSYNN